MVDASIGDRHLPGARRRRRRAACSTPTSRCTTPRPRARGCEVYTPERDASSRDRLALLGELRRRHRRATSSSSTTSRRPTCADGDVVGVEALVRWQHPERGLLAPGEFLPVAEQTALMRPLTLRVLDTALADCRRWRDDGPHARRRRQPRGRQPDRPRLPGARSPPRSSATACRPSCCSSRSPRTS